MKKNLSLSLFLFALLIIIGCKKGNNSNPPTPVTNTVVSTLAGSGVPGNTNATGIAASFNSPYDVAVDASGNLYVADQGNNLIRKITPTGIVSTFAGSGRAADEAGTGITASFNAPYGVVVDGSGNLYVTDRGSLVRKISPTGVVSTFASGFIQPWGITIDANGNIYVADQGSRLISKITPAGVVSTLAGGGAFQNTNGIGTAASFGSSLQAIAVDATGNVYVGDLANGVIRKITPAGLVSNFAAFSLPTGLAVDAAGNVYVANEDFITKTTPAGVLSYIAGSNTAPGGHADGAGSKASFYEASGLTIDASGNIYVADRGNNLIRKIVAQ